MYRDANGIEHESYEAACRYYGADTPAQLEREEAWQALQEREQALEAPEKLFTIAAYKGATFNGRPIFAIQINRCTVGELRWAYRPKNAGGPAWQATLFAKLHPVSWHAARREDALAQFKAGCLSQAGFGGGFDPEPPILRSAGGTLYVNGELK